MDNTKLESACRSTNNALRNGLWLGLLLAGMSLAFSNASAQMAIPQTNWAAPNCPRPRPRPLPEASSLVLLGTSLLGFGSAVLAARIKKRPVR